MKTLPEAKEAMVSFDFSFVINILYSQLPYFFFSSGMTRPFAAAILDTRGILDEQMYSQHLQEKQSITFRLSTFSASPRAAYLTMSSGASSMGHTSTHGRT